MQWKPLSITFTYCDLSHQITSLRLRSTIWNCECNRLLPSSIKSHFQNEAKCKTFLVKMRFNCTIIKIILASLWNRGLEQLENGLLRLGGATSNIKVSKSILRSLWASNMYLLWLLIGLLFCVRLWLADWLCCWFYDKLKTTPPLSIVYYRVANGQILKSSLYKMELTND